jgi:hypothetical protein
MSPAETASLGTLDQKARRARPCGPGAQSACRRSRLAPCNRTRPCVPMIPTSQARAALKSWLAVERKAPLVKPRALKRFVQRSRELARPEAVLKRTALDVLNLREARPAPCHAGLGVRADRWGILWKHCETLDVVPGLDRRGRKRAAGKQKPLPSGRGWLYATEEYRV